MFWQSIRSKIVGIALGLIILMVITVAMSMLMASKVDHLLNELTTKYIAEVDPDRGTAGAVSYGVARPISVPAPIALGATVMTSFFPSAWSTSIPWLAVVPVGMWAKAPPVGEADHPHIQGHSAS
jgi:hypothetical protein